MRVLNFVLAAALCGGVASFAGTASAQRLDEFFFIEDSQDPNNNECFLDVDDISFETGGDVSGSGTGGLTNTIEYYTPAPTKASANSNTASVTQGSFATLDFLIDGVSVSDGPQIIEKCNVSGNVNANKATGAATANCRGDNLNLILDANEVASFQTAFNASNRVKIKTNQNNQKWSISIKCKGEAFED